MESIMLFLYCCFQDRNAQKNRALYKILHYFFERILL